MGMSTITSPTGRSKYAALDCAGTHLSAHFRLPRGGGQFNTGHEAKKSEIHQTREVGLRPA